MTPIEYIKNRIKSLNPPYLAGFEAKEYKARQSELKELLILFKPCDIDTDELEQIKKEQYQEGYQHGYDDAKVEE